MGVPLVQSPTRVGLPYTPYLTVTEFKNEPTDVDVTSLVPNGNQAVQDAALARKIARASSWMDWYVHYVLAATYEVAEVGRYRAKTDGTVRVPVRGIPVLELDTFSVGYTPSTMGPISTQAAADAWIEDNILVVPAWSSTYSSIIVPGSKVYCQYSYVNGYPNTLLQTAQVAGDTSITVQYALGIYPGTQLTIYDSSKTEVVTVASTYVPVQAAAAPVNTVVPLSAGLQFAHTPVASGTTANIISVSALPPRVKEAAVLATSHFIKKRGAESYVMETIEDSGGKHHVGGEAGFEDELLDAADLLHSFVLPVW